MVYPTPSLKTASRQARCTAWRAYCLPLLLAPLLCSPLVQAAGSKVIGTGGATSIDGMAGGGIVPWALINGYASSDQWSLTSALSLVNVDDYQLHSQGVALSYDNRWELSYGQQQFSIDRTELQLRQQVFAAKYKLAGDALYNVLPQIAIGAIHKKQLDFALPAAIGVADSSDQEFYLAASKIYLDAVFGRNLLLNYTVRATRAQQTGLLGFATVTDSSYQWCHEWSAVLLLTHQLAIGAEYKQKPNTLAFAAEDDWRDVFVGWFINKHLSLVAGYVDLGAIAGKPQQDGYYLALETTWAF